MFVRKMSASQFASMSKNTDKSQAPPFMAGMRGQVGVTLIELMVAIAVFAILSVIAVPAYRYITSVSYVANESNSLISSFWTARSQAIEGGVPVTICTSSNGISCTSETSWQQGWIIFTDINSDQTVDPGDVLREVRTAFTSGDTVKTSTQVSAITFNREGFATGISSDITFAFHDKTDNKAITRCVLLERMGTALSESYGTGGCQ